MVCTLCLDAKDQANQENSPWCGGVIDGLQVFWAQLNSSLVAALNITAPLTVGQPGCQAEGYSLQLAVPLGIEAARALADKVSANACIWKFTLNLGDRGVCLAG